MAWIKGLVEHVVLFAIVLFGLTCLLGRTPVLGDDSGGLRVALYLAGLLALLEEWRRLNRNIVRAQQSITAVGAKPPRRAELGCYGCLAWGLLLPVAGLMLGVFSDFWSAEGLPRRTVAWGVASAAWAIVGLHVVKLVLGGFTWASTHHRLRKEVPKAARPVLGRPMPWVTLAMVLPVLGLSLFEAPDPDTTRALGQLALLALELPDIDRGGETPATASSTTELLLELGEDDQLAEVEPILDQYGARATRAFTDVSRREDADLAQTWVVTVIDAQAMALQRALSADRENVDTIELNAAVHAPGTAAMSACDGNAGSWSVLPVDDPYAPGQWALTSTSANTLLGRMHGWYPRKRATVAIIDTGVSTTPADLAGVVRGDGVDYRGHGTPVASVAGAIADNGHGIASLNVDGRWIRILDLPALAEPGAAADDVARDIIEAADDGAAVINLSFGERGSAPTAVRQAVAYAVREGSLLVAAAGNDGSTVGAAGQWPANIDGVIAVGAINRHGRSSGNRVDGVDLGLYAPGADVCVATSDGGYRLATGSSFAAPMVSGLIGVLAARCPHASQLELAAAVIAGARGGSIDVDAAWRAMDGCR